MLSKTKSCALGGMEGIIVDVEIDTSAGLPGFDLVGLADTAVREAKDRVRAAIKNSGYDFPPKKLVANLAPADIKKEGSAYDLAIAVGVLAGTGQIPKDAAEGFVFLGELSLGGELKSVTGALPLVLGAARQGYKKIILPAQNAEEASASPDAEIYGVRTLCEVAEFLKGEKVIEKSLSQAEALLSAPASFDVDFSDVKGQPMLKRAFEIAASGGHNVLVIGPPGAGKSMLAKRLPTILPDMSMEEAIETTQIHSIAGVLSGQTPIVTARPFRAPHHNISLAGLVGGGTGSLPGEVSLAHNGVLFLDEFLEFGPKTTEAMRQPIEDGTVTISRAAATHTYPCRTILVLAANPCPCGYYGDSRRRCTCTASAINKYMSKLSGPLLDRIDIQVEAASVGYDDLSKSGAETSAQIKERVTKARNAQKKRYKSTSVLNSDLSQKQIETLCNITDEAMKLARDAFSQLHFSMRGYHSVLSVARTIADLDGQEDVGASHVLEAIGYRRLENKYWRHDG